MFDNRPISVRVNGGFITASKIPKLLVVPDRLLVDIYLQPLYLYMPNHTSSVYSWCKKGIKILMSWIVSYVSEMQIQRSSVYSHVSYTFI